MSRITRRTIIPVNQITPLTYRDGVTYIQMLTQLSEYVKSVLHPSLQHTVDQLVADVENQLDTHRDQYVDGVQEFQRIHDAFMSDVNAHLIALNDSAMSDLVTDPSSSVGKVIREITEHVSSQSQGGQRVVANHPKFGEPYTKQSVINALDYAEELGPWTVVYFPRGVYELENGLSLAGYSVQIHGDGAGVLFEDRWDPYPAQGEAAGTVFQASTQRGPVLDFKGWVSPQSFQGKVSHGNFYVVGSHEADSSLLNSGIEFDSISSCHFHDIGIRGTGGPGVHGVEKRGNAVYLNNFSRIVVDTPVMAKENNVPYFQFNEANGNHFYSLAIRSRYNHGSGDCGVGGAFRIISNQGYASRKNVFDSTWIEFLHVPTDGTIFHVEAGQQEFRSTIFWDTYKERGATNTSHYRFVPPPIQDIGGNIVTGNIPSGPFAPNDVNIDNGIDNYQNGLYVAGTKGHRERHVILNEDVRECFIQLGGGASANIGYGVVNNSGNDTNTILDAGAGIYHFSKSSAITRSIDFRIGGIPQSTRVQRVNLGSMTTMVHEPGTILHYVLSSVAGVHSPQPGNQPGEVKTIVIEQDNTGGHQFVFAESAISAIDFQGGTPPTVNMGPGETTVLQFLWTGTNWSHIR